MVPKRPGEDGGDDQPEPDSKRFRGEQVNPEVLAALLSALLSGDMVALLATKVVSLMVWAIQPK